MTFSCQIFSVYDKVLKCVNFTELLKITCDMFELQSICTCFAAVKICFIYFIFQQLLVSVTFYLHVVHCVKCGLLDLVCLVYYANMVSSSLLCVVE